MNGRRKKVISAVVLLGTTLSLAGALATAHALVVSPHFARTVRAWWAGAEYLGEEGVIRQRTRYECGAVALQMLLRQRGVERDLDELKTQAGTGERGTSLLGLKQAAAAQGLHAQALRVGAKELSRVPLPAIAFVDGDHFVLVAELRDDGRLVVLDPARGRLLYDAGSFGGRWRGELLVVTEN